MNSNFTRAQIKAQAKEQLKGKVGSYILVTLAYVGIAMVIGFIGGLLSALVPILGTIAIYIVLPPLMIGFYMVFLNGTYGDKPEVATLFEGYKGSMFGKSLGLYWLVVLFTFLWTMLLIIPGIIKSFAYSMSWYILAENPDMKAKEAIEESKIITNGHKMDLFVLGLSFIPWILLCYVTLGIATFWVGPYMQLTYTNFYHNIKRQQAPAVEEVYTEPAAEVIE